MINALGSNSFDRLEQIKDQAALKSKISQLMTQLELASTKEAKAALADQLQSLAQNSGQTLSQLGFSSPNMGSIFSQQGKMAVVATPTGTTPTASVPVGNVTAGAAGKIDVSGLSEFRKDNDGVDGDAKNKVAGRSAADSERDWSVISDLRKELGIGSHSYDGEWIEKAKLGDRVTVYDKDGNLKTDFGTAIDERSGLARFRSGDIIEVKSEKYGIVRIQSGGDGNLNGRDDRIISIGNEVAANGITNGLNNINQGLATPAVAQVTQAQELAKLQVAGNPQLNSLASQNPYQLSDADIKNLLAAILQLVNQASK